MVEGASFRPSILFSQNERYSSHFRALDLALSKTLSFSRSCKKFIAFLAAKSFAAEMLILSSEGYTAVSVQRSGRLCQDEHCQSLWSRLLSSKTARCNLKERRLLLGTSIRAKSAELEPVPIMDTDSAFFGRDF